MKLLKLAPALILGVILIHTLPAPAPATSISISSSNTSAALIDFDLFLKNKSSSSSAFIFQVLKLFHIGIIHGHINLIIYGGKNLSHRHQYHGHQDEILFSTIMISTQEGVVKRRGNFKNVIASCLSPFHTEHRTIILIQPEDLEEMEEILNEISSFYESTPSKSFTLYFFVLWPAPAPGSAGFNDSASDSIFHSYYDQQKINNLLRRSVRTAPLDSHLYIAVNSRARARGETQHKKLDFGNDDHPPDFVSYHGWIIWEFYYVYDKYIFQPVSLKPREFHGLMKRREDFRGTSIRALIQKTVYLNAFDILMEINGTLEFSGIKYGLLHHISQTLNMKLDIVIGKGWMSQREDGSLTGIGEQLLNSEADITMSYSEMLPYRLKQLAASHPATEFDVNAYFEQPPPNLYRNILFQAFSPGMWALMLITWILIVTCLIAVSTVKQRFRRMSSLELESDHMIGGDAVCWAVGAACQSGWHYTPSSTSLQIIVICGLISSFVCYTAYSASIISIFSVELTAIHTLSDLLRHGFQLYGNVEALTGQYYVEDQAKAAGVPFQSRLINVTTALKKIQESPTAYVISREYFFSKAVVEQNHLHLEFCNFLSKLPRPIDRLYNVWYFRKFDPLRKFLNMQLTRWGELGLLYRLNMNLQCTLPAPCDPKKKEAIPLEFQDVRSAFFILFAGFLSCLSILLIELIAERAERYGVYFNRQLIDVYS